MTTRYVVDDVTIGERESGEIYVINRGTASTPGTAAIDDNGILTIADDSNGEVYRLAIIDGVLQPVEV